MGLGHETRLACGAAPRGGPAAAVAEEAGLADGAGDARLVPDARLVLVHVQRAGQAVALPVRYAAEVRGRGRVRVGVSVRARARARARASHLPSR